MKLMLDPYAFLTVVRNLMRNAAEHAAPATLRVTCLDAHSLAFSDNGPGIPPDELPLLFDRYFSARRQDVKANEASPDMARRDDQTRHGLGLAIARQMCRSEEHTPELQSLMRLTYAGFCLKKNNHA